MKKEKIEEMREFLTETLPPIIAQYRAPFFI